MKKKILFLLHVPPPVHGVAIVGQQIMESVTINREFQCTFLNISLSHQLDEIEQFSFKKIYRLLIIYLKAFWLLLKNRPHLVYVTPSLMRNSGYKDFILALIIKILGFRVVFHLHNKGASTTSVFRRICLRLFFLRTRVILLSPHLFYDVSDFIEVKQVAYCANGIKRVEQKKQIRTQPVQILFLSNMIVEKGVWDLLQVCSLLYSAGYQFECHFVGNWGNIQEIEFIDRINALKLTERVRVHGPLYGEEKEMFFQRADIFVLPSHNEAFPLVLLEAMQHGIPCIASNTGGIPDIIEDGKNGLLFPIKDTDLLYCKLKYLIDNPIEREAMGINAKTRFVKEFTIEQFEKRFVKCLKDFLR